MKKNTMITIASYIKNVPELANEYAELAAELNKGAEKAAANRTLYATAHDVVFAKLSDRPMTIADIWEVVKDEVPSGFTKSKLQYAMREYWSDEVVKIEGKVNEYRKRV